MSLHSKSLLGAASVRSWSTELFDRDHTHPHSTYAYRRDPSYCAPW
jgi:hypothetical protein